MLTSVYRAFIRGSCRIPDLCSLISPCAKRTGCDPDDHGSLAWMKRWSQMAKLSNAVRSQHLPYMEGYLEMALINIKAVKIVYVSIPG